MGTTYVPGIFYRTHPAVTFLGVGFNFCPFACPQAPADTPRLAPDNCTRGKPLPTKVLIILNTPNVTIIYYQVFHLRSDNVA